MADFGANSTVTSPLTYAPATKPKFKRVALAILLCGPAASIGVALISAVIAFIYSVLSDALGMNIDIGGPNSGGFGFGLAIAVLGGAFNWYFFYFTVPAAWLALGFSIGRFPRRGISEAKPYYRWGGIWGAALVGGVTMIAAGLFGSDDGQSVVSAIGGLVGGAAIGALAGVLCAALFRMIVRPEQQMETVDADVFA